MAQISFSIVVVCLNPGKKLLPTLSSVLGQQYGNYEIVIKDGGSSDGSLADIPADSRVRLVQSADTGIYDAMNQALSHLKGQFVLFLNCGDVFHDDQVLSRMAKAIENKQLADRNAGRSEKIRIFYGNQYNALQKSVVYSAPEVNDFTCYRNVPCHQVCFYDVRLFAERGYDTKYRVRADYEHFLHCIYERCAEAVYTEVLVADYEGGGFSETAENRRISAKEHDEITRRYLGREKTLKYKTVMLLTLAPLRTRLAEDERFSGYYNAVKTGVYRILKKRK